MFGRRTLLLAWSALACLAGCDDSAGSGVASAPDAPASLAPPLDAATGDAATGDARTLADAAPARPDAAPALPDARPTPVDHGPVADAPPLPMACDAVPIASTVGQACVRGRDCGTGGICAGPSGRPLQCHQLCIPDRCEDMCPAGARCRNVVGEDGQPQHLDDGSPVGVCRADGPVGDALSPGEAGPTRDAGPSTDANPTDAAAPPDAPHPG